MNQKLAIITPQIGIVSETFIKRHVCDLLPDQTVVVVDSINSKPGWNFDGPWCEGSRRDEAFFDKVSYKLRLGKSPVMQDIKSFLREHGVTTIMGEYLNFAHRWIRDFSDEFQFFGHAHGYDISQCLRDAKWRRAYQDFSRTNGIITMSQKSKEALLQLGLSEEKIYVVPYGVDVPKQFPEKETSETIRCLAVGRMVGKKAPLLLLQSFKEALDQSNTNATLDYIGDGPFFEEANTFVREHRLEKQIILHGSMPNTFVKEKMAKSDIFVQHSRVDPVTGDTEGLPVAILEAMAAGLAVISTHHAGIPEQVIDGETGLLSSEGNWNAMADNLCELFSNSAKREEMGAKGWQRALEKFSWEVERQSLLKIMKLDAE